MYHFKKRKQKSECKKICVKPEKLEKLLSSVPKSPEQKLDEWKKRYLQYLKGEKNYAFYEPYLALTKNRKGDDISQYLSAVKFHLEKHNGNFNIHKIIRMIR